MTASRQVRKRELRSRTPKFFVRFDIIPGAYAPRLANRLPFLRRTSSAIRKGFRLHWRFSPGHCSVGRRGRLRSTRTSTLRNASVRRLFLRELRVSLFQTLTQPELSIVLSCSYYSSFASLNHLPAIRPEHASNLKQNQNSLDLRID